MPRGVKVVVMEPVHNAELVCRLEPIEINCLPVDFATAPIRTAGIAITMHPNAATIDNPWALFDDFDDNTL